MIPSEAILSPYNSLYRDIGEHYLSQGKESAAYKAFKVHALNYPLYRQYELKYNTKFECSSYYMSLTDVKPAIDALEKTRYNFIPSFSSLKTEFQGWNNMVFVHPRRTGGTTFRDPLEQAIRFPDMVRKGLHSVLELIGNYSGKEYVNYLSHGSINNDINARAVIDILSDYRPKEITGSLLTAHGIKASGLINALEESVQNKVKKILILRNPRKRLESIARESLKNNPESGYSEIKNTLLDNSLFRAYIDDYSSQALSPDRCHENNRFDCIFDITDNTRKRCVQSLFLSSNCLPNIIYPAKVNAGVAGSTEFEARICDLTNRLIDNNSILLDEEFYYSRPAGILRKNCNFEDISDRQKLHPLVCVLEAGNLQLGLTKDFLA